MSRIICFRKLDCTHGRTWKERVYITGYRENGSVIAVELFVIELFDDVEENEFPSNTAYTLTCACVY